MRGRFATARVLVAAAVGVALLAGDGAYAVAVGASNPEVVADPEVRRAGDAVDDARGVVRSLEAELDAAAAVYEHANAHHLSLLEELEASDASVRAAAEDTAAATDALAARVVSAYKHAEIDAGLADVVLSGADPATAVHRTALVDRTALRGGAAMRRAQMAEVDTGEAVRQQRIIEAGIAAAAADLERAAQALNAAVARAQERATVAQADLDEARAAAVARIEERERRERERQEALERERQEALEGQRQAAADRERGEAVTDVTGGATPDEPGPQPRAAAGSRPTPAPAGPPRGPGGKVCPVGDPHGFIDSWGYPRSGGRRHEGVDIFADTGTPVYAVYDGEITRVWNSRLGGLSINLLDDAGDRYYYTHLSAQYAKVGQRVRTGEVIGAVGNTGNARTTPPHLHWQYHPGNGAPVNPYPLAASVCRNGAA